MNTTNTPNETTTSAILSLKHMAQGEIDHYALQIRIMSGVISHPDFNTFAHNTDLMVLLKDRVEEIVGYVDVACKANRVVQYPIRYADQPVREMLEEFGTFIGDVVSTKKYVPAEKEMYNLFEEVFDKHALKTY